jgi:hypothetical protein
MTSLNDGIDEFRPVPVRLDVDAAERKPLVHVGLDREQVVSYLTRCPIVFSARGTTPDRVSPDAAPIPIGFRTDGSWIWPLEAEAYVTRYGMTLPNEFLDRIRMHGQPPQVSARVAEAALQWILANAAADEA